MTRATEDVYGAWSRLVGDTEAGRQVWSDLILRWSEPHRKYHDLGHLVAILGIIEKYASYADDIVAVQLAAWYHDAIYDPRSPTNEADSAALAVQELTALGVPAERLERVRDLILMTAAHAAASDRDSALLSDADLAVLGSPAEAYLGYVNAVREEYAHVSDGDFRTGRSAILQGILDQEQIYRLAPIRAEIERIARRNIAAELSVYRPEEPAGDPMEQIMRNLPGLLPRTD